jgi:hypothetical protein
VASKILLGKLLRMPKIVMTAKCVTECEADHSFVGKLEVVGVILEEHEPKTKLLRHGRARTTFDSC